MANSTWRISLLFLLPFVWQSMVSATSSPIEAVPYSPPGHSIVPPRHLKAVSRRADLLKRDQRIERRYTADLRYSEGENQYGGSSAFVSSIQIKSKAPILVLEDIEELLSHVRCTEETIELGFDSSLHAVAAKEACHHEDGAYAITSHVTCNAEGERSVFKIHSINTSEDGLSLVLDVTETLFKEAFGKFDISFGHTSEPHLFRRHDRVLRRQESSSTDTWEHEEATTTGSDGDTTVRITSTHLNTAKSTITVAPSMPAISTVAVPSTAASTATSVNIDLGYEELDSTFAIPNNPLGQVPLTMGCKNCTTGGFLILSSGKFSFDFDVSALTDDDPNSSALIKSGNIQLKMNDFFAHIELSSKPSIAAAFEHSLFTAPVVGFVIPGIGQAGIAFQALVAVEFALSGGIELTYGFDLSVPTGSSIDLNFGAFANSTMKGFDSTTTTPIPFSFNTTQLNLTLTTAFRPTIPIGFSFAAAKNLGELTAEVSAFLDLPALSATISTQEDTDMACNPLDGTNSTLATAQKNTTLPASALNAVLSDMGPLILVEPAVALALAVGATFEAELAAFPSALPAFESVLTVFAKTFDLPTACLAPKSKFEPATAVFAAATKSLEQAAAASSSEAAAKANESQRQKEMGSATGSAAQATKTGNSAGRGGKDVGEFALVALVGVAVGFVML